MSRGLPVAVALLLVLSAVSFLQAGAGSTGPAVRAGSPPVTIVLQPDGANGTDTFLLDQYPRWNFGTDSTLAVGRDAANGSVARSLLRFDLSGVPANATVLDAALELFEYGGGTGTVEVRRAAAPWTEGSGGRSWSRVPLTVRETAGVRRTLEPVEVDLTFAPSSVEDPRRDVRVWSGPTEVPSQVYNIVTSGGFVTGARVVFGATVAAYGTQTFSITYSTNGTTVPAYRTKGLGSTFLWRYGPTGSGASGATVADLDGDGGLEVVFGGADGNLYILNSTGGLKRSVPLSGARSVPYTPQVRDLDDDGRMDIVVLVNTPEILRLNDTGGVVWSVPYGVNSIPYSTPTLTDVDGDGVLDVLIGGRTNRLDALNGLNGTLIRSYPAGGATFTASVLDLEGDGIGEIFYGSDDDLIHAYRADGTRIWENASANASFIETSVSFGDLDGDGIPEVVSGDDTNNGPEFAMRATDGRLLWERNLPSWRESGQTLADLDGDGTLEVLVGVWDALYALNGRNGTILWNNPGGTSRTLYPAVADIDNDGRPEIVYMDEGPTVRVLRGDGSPLWNWTITPNDPALRTLSQLPMATPAIADLDGDGTMEVLVPTGDGMTAFGTGGLARDWRTWAYNWNHTQRASDGNSPDGAPFLVVTTGPAQDLPAVGASWDYRDGIALWALAGGDLGSLDATANAAAGGWASWNLTSFVSDVHAGTAPNAGLFLLEADEAGGAVHRFQSSDAVDPLVRPRLTITYVVPSIDPVPRIVGVIPDMTRAEDSPPWSIDLLGFAADTDTSLAELRWNVSGYDRAKLGITGLNTPGNHLLTFYPQNDAFGDFRATYWLADPDGNLARQDAWIRLTPVNDAPTFNPPATLVVRYNQTYTFDFEPYVADIDDPLSDLTLSSDDSVQAVVTGFNVSFRYPASLLNQWVFVALTVTDGPASVSKVVAVKVTSDNPPVLTRSLPDITMMEGEFLANVFDLDDYFTDPDNDALFFSYGYSHLNITIHANHSVDIQAQAEWSGWERVTFRGNDSSGAIAEDAIIVTVLPINDPPSLGPVPDLRVHYDEPYLFNLEPYLSDPDTPVDQVNATTSSPYITVSLHLLRLLYPAALNGTVQAVTIWASDGTSTVTRGIRVTVGNDYPPSLLGKLPDRTFLEDGERRAAYNLSAFFDDPDSGQLYWSSGNRSVEVSIDPWGSVDLRAARDWFGTERVTFRAVDSQGALAEDTVWITVLPVNDAPFFRAVPAQALNVTTAFLDLSDYIGDVDNETSELVLSTASPRGTVVGHGILLRFDADASEAVEVVVSDGLLTNRTTVSVTVVLPKAVGEIPGWLYWLPAVVTVAGLSVLIVYRRRQLEWAFLVTNDGLLIASMFREASAPLDSDLLTGMLTVIMNFTRESFSDEKERQLEGLEMGDRRVAIVRGDRGYLAVVYKGRTPGALTRVMKGLLTSLETRHADLFGPIVDSSKVEDIPVLLQKLLKYGWWPFLAFPTAEGSASTE